MPAGHQAPDRSALASIMRRSAAGPIMRLLPLTAHTRTLFIIAHKIWSLRFVCAAMTGAPPMARRYQPTRRNAADYSGTLKSRLTEQFTFLTTAVVAQAPSLFQKIMA